MYGDFLVPTNTNVNNAITTNTGAKWELFFDETRDEKGNVGYEWDADFDGTRLNLNGVRIVISKTTNTDDLTSSAVLRHDGNNILSNTFASGVRYGLFEIKIENGCLSNYFIGNVTNIASTSTPSMRIDTSTTTVNSITNFAFDMSNVPENTNFKIYVLRGV